MIRVPELRTNKLILFINQIKQTKIWKVSLIFTNKKLDTISHLGYILYINPNVARVEGAADPRRQGCSCSNLPQPLDNAGDAVSSAFP